MRGNSGRALRAWGLAAGLAVVMGTLAVLQYEWIGEVSEAQRGKMQTTLHTAMNQFRQDVHHNLANIDLFFEVKPADTLEGAQQAYAERAKEWRERGPYPDLVAGLFLWSARPTDARLLRLDETTRKFLPSPCPSPMSKLCEELKQREAEAPHLLPLRIPPWMGRPEGEAVAPRIPLLMGMLEGEVPALVPPIFEARRSRGTQVPVYRLAGYLIIVLDRKSLQGRFFPDLARRYFGGAQGLLYDVAVLNVDNPNTPIYISEPIPPHQILASADAAIPLFGPPNEDFLRWQNKAAGLAHGEGDKERLRFNPIPPSPEPARQVRASLFLVRPRGASWELAVRRRSGSVEEAVASVRRRQLAVSFGILLVLGMSMAMLLVWTQRAQRLAQLQLDFAAGVSHELRTPVAVITSAADNLAAGVVASKEQIVQYAHLIRGQARQLTQLIEQVLLFASTREGGRAGELRPLKVATIIEGALANTACAIQAAGFAVECAIDDGLPRVMGDPAALTQCVQILISNAVKYGSEARWLGIRACQGAGQEVKIIVEDRGMGIDAADLDHIFEPFYRGQRARAAQIHGTGLGLTILKNIARGAGCQVSARSEPGRGSSFSLCLRVCDEARAVLEQAGQSALRTKEV